jgi:predicted  nucleic acid-binding Zn-ribbon protein
MSQLQALLSYQQIDQKLFKIDNDLAKSESYQKYAKLRKFLKAAPEKVDALEAKAAALKAETAELAKQYEQVENTLGDYENLEELVGGGADISFYKKNVQAIVEKLKKLKADISALVANIQAIDEEYQALKKKVKAAQKQYTPAEEEYKAAKKAVEGERNAYQAQLNEAAKSLDESVLARYLTKRKEGTPFPIVAELASGRCPVCGMEPPIAAQGKLADGIECDSCHRIIFKQ